MTNNDTNDASDASAAREIAYADFGRRFFEHTVTQARIASALSNLTGNEIDFGPRSAGPGKVARVTGHGEIGEIEVQPDHNELICFNVAISVRIRLDIKLAGHDNRFDADLMVNLRLTARALAPLRIFIDVRPPTEDDVEVELQARGLRASVLNIAANIDRELRHFVARRVTRQIDKPEIQRMRDIDIAARIDKAKQG